jgi:hypothetical protein
VVGILVSKNEKRFLIRETDWLSRGPLVICTLGFYIGKIRVGGAAGCRARRAPLDAFSLMSTSLDDGRNTPAISSRVLSRPMIRGLA